MIGLQKGRVSLQNHNPNWKILAKEISFKLSAIFPTSTIIEHIGSTSIPSIKAKPIIDLAVGVEDLKRVEDLLKDLNQLGFTYYKEVGDASLMYFNKKNEAAITTHHLHVLNKDSQAFKNHLYFRDYLREHQDIAKKYEDLKGSLALKYPMNRDVYTLAKDPFIKQVIRKAQVQHFLGKEVTITIDRPIGTSHPKHKEIHYPINYGYIANEIAPDDEELDVYLLGVTQKVQTFKGTIIAIIHRENDVEDKLVMSTKINITKEEIIRQTHFQEQFYKSTIEVYQKGEAS